MTKEEYVKAANVALESGDYEKARQIGEEMVGGGIHSGYLQMAVADRCLGNLTRADEEIREYLTQDDTADGWHQYGIIRQFSGDHLRAAEFFDKAAERGNTMALGYAAANRFSYANKHVNDDPNNVDRNLELFDLVENAIIQSAKCIQVSADEYDFYDLLPQMIYLDYSMIAAGRTSYYKQTETTTDLYGNKQRKISSSYVGGGGSSLGEMMDSLDNKDRFVEEQKVRCKNRAAKIAQILRDAGKEAEASMVMFEMLYAEVTLDGKNSSAPKAAAYYTQALENARATLSDEAYKTWTEEFSYASNDYFSLMQKNGKRIAEAQKNGGKTKADKAKEGSGIYGIIYAIGTMPFLGWVLTLAGGFMAMFGRTAGQDGNPIGMIGLIIFGLVCLLIGIIVGNRKNLDADPRCLRLGALLVFLLSIIHIGIGIVAVIVSKILAHIWE